jgi:hypothetical protein
MTVTEVTVNELTVTEATVTEVTVTERSALHQPQMSRLHSHPKRRLRSAAVGI